MQFTGRLIIRPIITKCILAGRIGLSSGFHGQSVGREPIQSENSLSKFKDPAVFLNEQQPVSGSSIKSAHQPSNSRNLLVELANGQRYEFPLVWLRDNCQFSGCFHPASYSRIHDRTRFNPDSIAIQRCSVTDDGTQVDITWRDGHRSQFNASWLEDRNFTERNSRQYLENCYRPKQKLWKKEEFGEIFKSFEFADVISKDEALQAWIEALVRYGVVIIRNAPLTKRECLELANRVGFPKRTHYGEQFVFKYREDPANATYMDTLFKLHTDLPSREYTPGCNLLHCLIQAGRNDERNLLVDAFSVADRMRREYPDNFRLLSQVPVNWSDVGEADGAEFHTIYRAPVICLDREGNLERINHSVPKRNSRFNVPLDRVEPWYRAMACFGGLLQQQAVEFKTWQGDILAFDNVRMVHGRTGFEGTNNVVGAYLDWDQIYSRLRVLRKKGMQK